MSRQSEKCYGKEVFCLILLVNLWAEELFAINEILSWRLICGYCVAQHFHGLETVIAVDLWPERRIYHLLVCANCNHQQLQLHPWLTWWPWKLEMGQKLCDIKLPLKVQIYVGDLPGKWDEVNISSWLSLYSCTWSRAVKVFALLMGWVPGILACSVYQTTSSVAPSGGYFFW